ncbi:MurR/RpiR family transcriptional regulator [Vibrio algivorus]|uniref:MurR/RpiR family transcriptional regulator n=1 Tax=Vibrio algivorus TaxID=1667024 RepID=A0A557PC17_9VIBR|nr:MurR/RpiR family transcriptional regulator [Vibrio algivorus]TVO38202.1 MurR/RpiR family transcriptional regulator [Vibrio algivorus]
MNVEIDIVSRINEVYPELKGTEKKVAHAIIDDLEFAASASITELAEQAAVSEASVTRFSKTLGCRNIRELKMKITKSLAIGQRFIYEKPDESGIGGIYESAKNIIHANRNAISEDALNKACELIVGSRQVLSVGMGGGSTIMAQELQFRLFRLGFVITAYNDGLLSRMVASTIDKSDVFVVMSVSGYTQEIIDVAVIAKQYGAKIIAITNPDSELAKVSDVTLPILSEEGDFIYKPSASRYAMMVAVDILAYRLAVMQKQRSRDKLRRIKINLDNHRSGGDRQPLGD